MNDGKKALLAESVNLKVKRETFDPAPQPFLCFNHFIRVYSVDNLICTVCVHIGGQLHKNRGYPDSPGVRCIQMQGLAFLSSYSVINLYCGSGCVSKLNSEMTLRRNLHPSSFPMCVFNLRQQDTELQGDLSSFTALLFWGSFHVVCFFSP